LVRLLQRRPQPAIEQGNQVARELLDPGVVAGAAGVAEFLVEVEQEVVVRLRPGNGVVRGLRRLDRLGNQPLDHRPVALVQLAALLRRNRLWPLGADARGHQRHHDQGKDAPSHHAPLMSLANSVRLAPADLAMSWSAPSDPTGASAAFCLANSSVSKSFWM